ncbi:MAG: OadG family protein [Spirochaetaceae bacterium]|jgi:oxaloacetate decarboxylase gamma subunit|nr:OadG family protein [Spirochaetaceae bacterium]
MNISEMFAQSVVVMLLGMGVVFGFLVLLILCITSVGRIIHAFGTDKDANQGPSAKAAVSSAAGVLDGSVVSAISAAVKAYRKE